MKREFDKRLALLFDVSEFKNAQSVLLLGSVARGEQSYLEYKGELQCLSDIEALVIFSRPPDSSLTKSIQTKIKAMEQAWMQRSPLFHLDISIGVVDRLSRLPRSILAHEMRERGIIIRGEDVRSRIPVVTPQSIDLGAVNELILIRLWSLLLYMPRQIVTTRATPFEQIVFRYISCRNALEVLTILYPSLGILLPSYKERVTHLKQIEKQPLYQAYFGQDITEFIRIAFSGKMSPQQLHLLDGLILYKGTIDIYFAMISFLLETKLSPATSNWDHKIEGSRLHLRDKRIVRRNAHELIQAWQMGRRTNPVEGVRWAMSRRRRLTVCFLLHMHLALFSSLSQQPKDALQHIRGAERYLSFIWPEANTSAASLNAPFADQWLGLREEFLPFMSHFYRFNRDKGTYFRATHNWTDAS